MGRIAGTLLLAGLALVGVLLPVPGPGQLGATQGTRYLLNGDDVSIYNLAGRIRLEAGAGSAVEVEVVKGGRDAQQLGVEVGWIGLRNALRVAYPGDRVVYPAAGTGIRTEVRVQRDNTIGGGLGGRRVLVSASGQGLEAHADMVIRVPSGKGVVLHLAAGVVVAERLRGTLQINGHCANVDIRHGQGSHQITTGTGNVRVEAVDGLVEIGTGAGRVELVGVQGQRLTVSSASGPVLATDVSVDELSIRSTSGRIDTREVRANRAEISTASAAIQGYGLNLVTLEVSTSSGRIDLQSLRAAELAARSADGQVQIVLSTGLRRAGITSTSGDVSLSIPEGIGAEYDIRTGSGDIHMGIPVTIIERSPTVLRGRSGAGEARIEIRTGSGNVRLVREPEPVPLPPASSG